ncbi:hypothetical protein Goarm_006192 [Gossypium armourianum]|uniref:RNase H type-1 domain-containing protein n=1 Tax=Gossypium armourianum TaxID=34283 RepID=A0A7J9JH85_9ROSI|nr:hypothetical protein [Gossypium armourianum]
MGPLVTMIPSYLNLDLDNVLIDMVLGNGTWNLDVFRLWLPEVIVCKITGIPPPHLAVGGTVINRNGDWIFGFTRFLGSCLVFEAELWGILDGLSI